MDSAIHRRVTDQFSPTATSYATSGVHANSAELGRLVDLLDPKPADEAIDTATGAGHMALALAPRVSRVVAYDLTRSMLDQTLATARERGLANVEAVQGAVEKLPFEDGSFDIYTVRLAPHHFADIEAFASEAFRVLRPGGRFLVVDTTAPEEDVFDRELNEIELLRDPSHVRNYRPSEWRALLEGAGFEREFEEQSRCGELEFHDWTRRQNTSPENKSRLQELFKGASRGLREVLELRQEGETFFFTLPQITIVARKHA